MATNDFSTLGGAYSILGQATTAEYNRRRREEDKARRRARRDARREQLLAYLAKPILDSAGTAIAESIQSPFTEKHNEFFRNEEIQKMLRSQKKARKDSEELSNTLDLIHASGFTREEYFTDDSVKRLRTSLENEYREKKMNPIYYEGAINAEARRQAEGEDGIGKRRALAFTAALEQSRKLSSESDINAFIKARNTRPKSLWGSIGKKAKSFFSGGDTQEQRDAKALEALQGSKWALSEKTFRDVMLKFRASGGNYADAVAEFSNSDNFYDLDADVVTRSVTESVSFLGNTARIIIKNTQTDKRTGVSDTLVTFGDTELLIDKEGQRQINEAGFLKKQLSAQQWENTLSGSLTPAGKKEFYRHVARKRKEDSSFVLGTIKTFKDYDDILSVYQNILAGNYGDGFILDTVQDSNDQELLMAALNSLRNKAAFAGLYAGGEEPTQEDLETLSKELFSDYMYLAKFVKTRFGIQTPSPASIQSYSPTKKTIIQSYPPF